MTRTTPITPHPKRTAMAHHVVVKHKSSWLPIAILIVLAPFVIWASVWMVGRFVRLVSVAGPTPVNSTVLKPAETGSIELAGELTTDTARVNGVKCPVYVRSNGTHFALVGGERIDVERVAGYARANGNAVAGHYRTVADGSRGNNFSADLHK